MIILFSVRSFALDYTVLGGVINRLEVAADNRSRWPKAIKIDDHVRSMKIVQQLAFLHEAFRRCLWPDFLQHY